MQLAEDRNRDRLKAAIGVAACHILIGYALVTGLRYEVAREVGHSLKLFDIAEPPPPPAEEPAPAQKTPTPEGAAAPPSLKAEPPPIVVPPPKIRLPVPPPLPTAPKPSPLPPGSATSAGSAKTAGAGSGAGGEGSGTGSGGRGSGPGGGSRAQRIAGSISGATDYPPAAKRAGIEGSVSVRYTVGTDGRVSGCAVTGSSGHAELDAATCRIIERRFRYRPATDAQGRPVPETVRRTFDWLLPYRRTRE